MNFLKAVFEMGLTLPFMMLVVVIIMLVVNYYDAAIYYFCRMFPAIKYKQTSIIVVQGKVKYHRSKAREYLWLTCLNIIAAMFICNIFALGNLFLALFSLYMAAAHAKVLGQYEQDLWDADCNK